MFVRSLYRYNVVKTIFTTAPSFQLSEIIEQNAKNVETELLINC